MEWFKKSMLAVGKKKPFCVKENYNSQVEEQNSLDIHAFM